MKRIYSLLPKQVAHRLRGIIEFDGGVTDTYLLSSRPGAAPWDIIYQGTDKQYRPAPGSNPKPIIPTEAHGRTYDINYFPRDVRRNNDAASVVPVEDSFSGEQVKALPRERLVDKPETGSPGAKNPDVFRYDPSGARSAMTANWPALQRSLAAARPTQLPGPVWERHPTGESLAVQEKLGAQGVFLGATKDRRKRGWMQANITDA